MNPPPIVQAYSYNNPPIVQATTTPMYDNPPIVQATATLNEPLLPSAQYGDGNVVVDATPVHYRKRRRRCCGGGCCCLLLVGFILALVLLVPKAPRFGYEGTTFHNSGGTVVTSITQTRGFRAAATALAGDSPADGPSAAAVRSRTVRAPLRAARGLFDAAVAARAARGLFNAAAPPRAARRSVPRPRTVRRRGAAVSRPRTVRRRGGTAHIMFRRRGAAVSRPRTVRRRGAAASRPTIRAPSAQVQSL